MSFFLPVLSGLFSSPLVRNTIGTIAGGLWDTLKKNATNAASNFVNNTVNDSVRTVREGVRPIVKQARRYFPEDDREDFEGQGGDGEGEEETGEMVEEEPMAPPQPRGRSRTPVGRFRNNRKPVARKRFKPN